VAQQAPEVWDVSLFDSHEKESHYEFSASNFNLFRIEQ
jgi:hypothetical protein